MTVSAPRGGAFDGLLAADAMRARGAMPRRRLIVADLRNCDIVQWLRLKGDIRRAV